MKMQESHLDFAYEAASIIRSCVEEGYGYEEIDWDDEAVLVCLTKYSRITLLHYYIFANICAYERRRFRKDVSEFFQIEAAMQLLRTYEIEFVPYKYDEDSDSDEDMFDWFESNENAFLLLWEQVADEVFQLLLRNRWFLLQFNKGLAEFLGSGAVQLPPKIFEKTGYIKRESYFPTWLRKGIFHRDQGICALCQQDLTSLFHRGAHLHFDHIVPLAAGGVNDPSNLQLLCAGCNLSKSGNRSITSKKYVPFWSLDLS